MAGAAASSFMDALSVRGQSISSGGSGESRVSSNLARDLSVRSENVVGAGHHAAVQAQAARLLATRSNTTRNKSKGEVLFIITTDCKNVRFYPRVPSLNLYAITITIRHFIDTIEYRLYV